jgi:cell division protein FtsW
MAEASTERNWDYLLLVITLSLTLMGLVMLLSSSAIMAQKRFGDAYYFFRPQVAYVLLGLLIMVILKNVPYQLFCKLSYPMLLITVAALIVVLIPGLGFKAGGASRWLRVGSLSFQPSELAKMTMVIYLAYSLASKREKMKEFMVGIFPHLFVLAIIVPLVLAEPDLGSSMTLILLSISMMFVAGVRFRYLIGMALITVPAAAWLIMSSPYRLKRITAFLSPWDDPLGAGYHIIHSFYAFASGGLTGLGPGGGQQKLFFLPEPHTDFIFSVVGEEFGFIGVTLVALLFLILVIRGISIALNAYELEGTYLALGLTLVIGFQAFINMAVVVGLLPTKGLTLPFFSYGGSAMLVNFACIGLLLNVASQGKVQPAKGRRGDD